MKTIKEVLFDTQDALKAAGFPPGGDVYDDFAAAVQQLIDGETVNSEIPERD